MESMDGYDTDLPCDREDVATAEFAALTARVEKAEADVRLWERSYARDTEKLATELVEARAKPAAAREAWAALHQRVEDAGYDGMGDLSEAPAPVVNPKAVQCGNTATRSWVAAIPGAWENVWRGILQKQDYHAGGQFTEDVDALRALLGTNEPEVTP